jgi:hypothetical protein
MAKKSRSSRRNNVSMRKRRNNVSMRKRRNNVSMRKRRNNVSMRKRRNNMTMRRAYMYGGNSTPANVNDASMKPMEEQSLAQGQQFEQLHKNQHGGGLDAGPFPGAVVAPTILPMNLHASARVAPLDAAIREISGLKDQSGGKRKARKASKKSRKASKKARKASKKSRKGRKAYRGGSYDLNNAQSVSASGLLLSPSMEAKALSGMNAEWKLAENPMAFAPGYKTY